MNSCWDNNIQNNEIWFHLCTNKAYMSVWIEGGGSLVHQNPKKWSFACSITHPATIRMFGQEHASYLDENVQSSSSALLSFTRKIIGHSEWWTMAPRHDQLTLEARLMVLPGAEIQIGCIRRTGVIWSYELRLSCTTCQNDRNKNSYTLVAHFIVTPQKF